MSFKFGDLFFGDCSFGRISKYAAGGFAAVALIGCISDGPNKTGAEYLANHGIVLQNPLYHVVLNNFPVDRIWTSETEPSHLGDSILLAGKSRDFSAKFRLAFEITDSNFIDSAKTTKSFKLSLTPHFPTYGIGKNELVGSVGTKSDTAKSTLADSLTFIVSTTVNADINATGATLSEDDRIALFAKLNRPFMARFEDENVLPASNVQDTIKIQAKGLYDSLQYQINALPHLLDTLISKPISTKWLIQMQLTPLFKNPDSLNSFIRLGGNSVLGSAYRPSLLFGSATNSLTATAGQKIQPMAVAGYNGGNFIGVNYKLDYTGSDLNLVTAKNRGWHLQMNRKTLMDSINAELKRQGKIPATPDITGNFDVTYFVPFGQISLPLDSTKYFENNFPLDLRLSTDLDSILPQSPDSIFTSFVVPLDKKTVLWTSVQNQSDANQTDTISVT